MLECVSIIKFGLSFSLDLSIPLFAFPIGKKGWKSVATVNSSYLVELNIISNKVPS
jgi:hypothetical protein